MDKAINKPKSKAITEKTANVGNRLSKREENKQLARKLE